jgi:hypothetical protein
MSQAAPQSDKDKRKRNRNRLRNHGRGRTLPHSGDPDAHLKGANNPTLPRRRRRELLHLRDVSEYDDEELSE